MADTSTDVDAPAAKRRKVGEPTAEDQTSTLGAMGLLPEKTREMRISREIEMGIQAWLSAERNPLRGAFKSRVTDFLVNEVDLDGNVVCLTDTETVPVDVVPEPEPGFPDWATASAALELPASLTQQLSTLSSSSASDSVSFDAKGRDKPWRRQFHQAIRQHWSSLTSTTIGDGIAIGRGGAVIDGRGNKHQQYGNQWPSSRPKYLCAVLRKWNRDTTDVIQDLCKILRVKANVFSFAGTKDKRAVTCQLITAWKINAERLRGLNNKLRGVEFGNFRYVSTELGLGDLQGNRFSIVLRNFQLLGSLEDTRAYIHSVSQTVSTAGFINYFGLQRFGSGSIPTHHIGRSLLKSDWKSAVDLIMQPRGGEHEDAERARAAYAAAPSALDVHLAAFPRKLTIERMILETLAKSGSTAYLNAIQALPRPTRLLYLHAYQSFVWNSVASRRVQLGPLHPIPGDLVMVSEHVSENRVRLLESVEEIASLGVQLSDVVLPLPGHQVIYPNNYTYEFYIDVMAKDDLNPREMSRKISDFSLPGSYRYLIAKPKNLEWKILNYQDPEADLNIGEGGKMDGALFALQLSFTLASSSYATMLLREFCKMPSDQFEDTD